MFLNFRIQVKTDDLKNVLNTQMYSPQDGNAHLGRFTVDPKYTDFIGMSLICMQDIMIYSITKYPSKHFRFQN